MILAKIWLRLNWLYTDFGDDEMKLYTAKTALESYLAVYEKSDVNQKQLQQLCMIIGELYIQTDDIQSAKRYLHMAKTNKDGTRAFTIQAEERLNKLKG
jgi:uncharacterized protein (DUF2225 family)